jgi:hypothetical protein
VNSTLDFFGLAAGAVSPNQFDLQMVQRVNVRESVFDGSRQRRIVG